MRRRLIPIVPLFALALLVGAIQSRAHADAAGPAQITTIEGPVGVCLPNQKTFATAQVGEWLPDGSVLRTGLHGKAGLHWANGGDFVVEPLGELKIEDPNDTRVDAGQVWARYTHKLLAPFSFHSPSATAVVRGTILGVRVDGLGVSRVTVFRGLVEVTDVHGHDVMLHPGQGVNATADQGLGAVGPLGDDDRTGNAFPPNQPGNETLAPAPAPSTNTAMQKQANSLWGRLDDMTHGGLDWLDRNRAAERMPLMSQELRREPLHRTGAVTVAQPPVTQDDRTLTPVHEAPVPTAQPWTPGPAPTPVPQTNAQTTHQTGQPDLAK